MTHKTFVLTGIFFVSIFISLLAWVVYPHAWYGSVVGSSKIKELVSQKFDKKSLCEAWGIQMVVKYGGVWACYTAK